MNIKTNHSTGELWQDLIRFAEKKSDIILKPDVEEYLVTLLMRYMDQPELAQKIFATRFLESLKLTENKRNPLLQTVGDECLLYAGLFPKVANRRHVKINYFVDLGRSAYAGMAKNAKDIFWLLAVKFVVLMDVLQTISTTPHLLPIEAYEQWCEVGSERAYKMLKAYTNGIPFKDK